MASVVPTAAGPLADVPAALPRASAYALSARVNNFDLIRLFAALQVVVEHAIAHLRVSELHGMAVELWYLPGVPIFFVISGYLISLSWERAPSAGQYAWNRILRIFPALWTCLAVSIVAFLLAGVRPSAGEFLPWLVAQLTVVQFYNPDFLRGFGVGVINGSLWTISVELQFYLVIPLLALLAGRRAGWWVITAIALAVMLPAHDFMGEQERLSQKLLGVTLIPYLFYFLVGVIARKLQERYPGMFVGKGLWWAAAYLAWVVIARTFDIPRAGGNLLNPVTIVLIGFATVSVAFTWRGLSARLLNGNDISYGVYIYHMPLINLLLFYGIPGLPGFFAAVFGTIALATLSWRLVERPALGLKRYTVRG